MARAIALCSCPRLGFLDFMGQGLAAFAANGMAYRNLFGVFWAQALSNGIKTAIEEGYEYIITTDYDSIFTAEDVAQLLRLGEQNPHADAIFAMQMGRFSGLLLSTENGEVTRKELIDNALVPATTGHFGLTLLRASSFADLPKPWFWATPDEHGEWVRGGGKVDDDIYFWDNMHKAGKNLFVAPRIVIGHLELLVKWPSDNMDGIYTTLETYHSTGKPADVWK